MTVFLQIIMPISTFLLSIAVFYFTFSDFSQKKTNLKLSLVVSELGNNNELLVDRENKNTPDPYTDKPYRFIPTVHLINKSSQPITVFEMHLHDKCIYNRFTFVGDNYRVTYANANKGKTDGITWFGGGKTPLFVHYSVKGNSLKLPLTLAPFEAMTGCIVFSYEKELKGHTTIYLKTSRGDLKYNVMVGRLLSSHHQHETQPL